MAATQTTINCANQNLQNDYKKHNQGKDTAFFKDGAPCKKMTGGMEMNM
jgi:hypothetical protein